MTTYQFVTTIDADSRDEAEAIFDEIIRAVININNSRPLESSPQALVYEMEEA